MLTVRQFAESLSVSQCTVNRWIKAGKIRSVKLGHRTVRIPEAELSRVQKQGLPTN